MFVTTPTLMVKAATTMTRPISCSRSTTRRRVRLVVVACLIFHIHLGKFFHERIEFLTFHLFRGPKFFFGHFIFIRFAQSQCGVFECRTRRFETFFLFDRVPDRCRFAFVLLIDRGRIQTTALENFFPRTGVSKQITAACATVLTLSCRTGFELERFWNY